MKRLLFITLLICFTVLAGCGNQSALNKNAEVLAQMDIAKAAQQAEIDAQMQVIEKFKNERDVLGTGKFIEDTAAQYPNNVVINTIYNYYTATECVEYAPDQPENNWMEQARAAASKISPAYSGPFAEEIIPFCKKLLGDEWAAIQKSTKEMEAKFNSLTSQQKIEIYEYIRGQYDAYNAKEGQDKGDKYSKVIWECAAKKFGLTQDLLMKIWCDTDVMRATAQKDPQNQVASSNDVTDYDATLDYKGQESLIAISEDAMDRFLTAINKQDEGTMKKMQDSMEVATVPIGTKVNIVKEKIAVTKVEILDGLYKGNTVWVLVESVHRH